MWIFIYFFSSSYYEQGYNYNNLLENSGVALLHGSATLVDAHTVRVGDTEYRAEKILIATGGWPSKPDIPGAEHGITSNEVFYLEEFPQRAVVIGGGYIAVEFAGVFNGLGADTHLLYRGEQILRGFDGDVRDFAAEQIINKGVSIHTHTDVKRIDKLEDGTLRCQLTNGDMMDADCVLFATGRTPMTDGLNLDTVGVETRSDGTISVDHFFRTSVPSIYALGDVIGTPQLTPVALAQAMKLVAHWYAGDQEPMSYDNIPTAVFCQPNIGTVGYSEEQARETFGDIRVFTSQFRHLKHTLTENPSKVFLKLIVDVASDRVVGAHMLGDDAGEVAHANDVQAGLVVLVLGGHAQGLHDVEPGLAQDLCAHQ